MSLRTRVTRLQRRPAAAGHCWRCGGEHAPDLATLQLRLDRAKTAGGVLLCDCPCCWPLTAVVADILRELRYGG
ncbi:MAG TPA: hypothetical protein VII06_30520 [Chloroflexota bacterium]|jgi:hypothetical protein